MNQTQFIEICEATALALHTEATEEDGRYSMEIDGIEVLLALDEDDDPGRIFCLVDLGEASPHDRAQVCEQLLELNLHTHGIHNGAYAFDIASSRAIFAGRLPPADILEGEYVADMLRFYVEETEAARRMVGNPVKDVGLPISARRVNALFTATLA